MDTLSDGHAVTGCTDREVIELPFNIIDAFEGVDEDGEIDNVDHPVIDAALLADGMKLAVEAATIYDEPPGKRNDGVDITSLAREACKAALQLAQEKEVEVVNLSPDPLEGMRRSLGAMTHYK